MGYRSSLSTWVRVTNTSSRQHGAFESRHKRSCVAFIYLRCHKVGCVARRHEKSVFSPQLLGKAKVTDAQALGVPGLIHIEDVTGFEVPMDDLGAEGWVNIWWWRYQ